MDEVTKNLEIGTELALPDEVPQKPDLSHLPTHVLRSNAIETLLQQNEELMSRLSVNLRRITHLENTLEDQDNKVKKIQHHYQNLKDELFILNQKTSSSTEQLKIKSKQLNEVKAKHKAIDYEYTQLFSQNKLQNQQFTHALEKLKKRLNSHLKYRKNIQPLVQKLKQNISAANHSRDEFSGQNTVLKDKLSALTSYIQDQASEFVEEKNTLVEQFKTDAKTIEQLEKSLTESTDRLKKNELEVIRLQNENIKVVREANEKKEASEALNSESLMAINEFKTELKKIKIENLELKQQQQDQTKELELTVAENTELKEQLENTQMFFSSLQKLFEKEQTKTESLQKINRKLSQEMNSYRGTIQSLKNIKDQKEVIRKPKNETLDKIENLIFEIERDFR